MILINKNILDLICFIASVFLLIPLISIISNNYKNKKAVIRKRESCVTSLCLFVLALCFLLLEIYLNSLITFISSSFWMFIVFQKIYYDKKRNAGSNSNKPIYRISNEI